SNGRRDRSARPPLPPVACLDRDSTDLPRRHEEKTGTYHHVSCLLTLNSFGPKVSEGACFARFAPRNRTAPPAAATPSPAAPSAVLDSFDTSPDTNSPPDVWRKP